MRDKNQPLHLKYRPQNFEEFIGNEATIDSLQSIVARESGDVRAFLFTGKSGCGKTTLARIIGNELGCDSIDFLEYNSANVRGIDTIRDIAESCRYAPMSGKVKIFLLDEVHKTTNEAQNALLKLLEDTPKYVRFILCTTDPGKLIQTIVTRCSVFHLSPLRKNQILRLLKWIHTEEGIEEMPPQILNKIYEYCDGSPRRAVVMLNQVIHMNDEKAALQVLIDSTIDETSVKDLCEKLLNSKSSWEEIAGVLKNIKGDPEQMRIGIMRYMKKVLLYKNSERAANVMEFFQEPFYVEGECLLVLNSYRISQIK